MDGRVNPDQALAVRPAPLQWIDAKLTPDEIQRLDDVSVLPPEYPGWMIPVQGADRTDPAKARFGWR
ncbi:MAG TPA: hypothetical protein VGM05_01255 [Planctomycetaceae bacterium]